MISMLQTTGERERPPVESCITSLDQEHRSRGKPLQFLSNA